MTLAEDQGDLHLLLEGRRVADVADDLAQSAHLEEAAEVTDRDLFTAETGWVDLATSQASLAAFLEGAFASTYRRYRWAADALEDHAGYAPFLYRKDAWEAAHGVMTTLSDYLRNNAIDLRAEFGVRSDYPGADFMTGAKVVRALYAYWTLTRSKPDGMILDRYPGDADLDGEPQDGTVPGVQSLFLTLGSFDVASLLPYPSDYPEIDPPALTYAELVQTADRALERASQQALFGVSVYPHVLRFRLPELGR